MSSIFAISLGCLGTSALLLLWVRWSMMHQRRRLAPSIADISPVLVLQQAMPQRVGDFALRKSPDWQFLVPSRRRRERTEHTVSDIISGVCRSPVPVALQLETRSDRVLFHPDAGDLSDPAPVRSASIGLGAS